MHDRQERCDECGMQQPNVGKWQDGRRLCGGCKIRLTLSKRPNLFRDISRELSEATGVRITVELERGKD